MSVGVGLLAALPAVAFANNSVGVGVGGALAPFRDQQVSSRRQSGSGLLLTASLDVLDQPRLDRLGVSTQ